MKSNNQRLDDLESKAGLHDEPDMIEVITIRVIDEGDPLPGGKPESTRTWRKRLPTDDPASPITVTVLWDETEDT